MTEESKEKLPEPIPARVKPSDHQPSKAEMEDEIDMPGWSPDRVRKTFMRPFVVKKS